MPGSIHFEEFALDLERYELRRSGRAVKLERMPMELLILLLESDGKLVRRDAINRRLWGEQAQQDTESGEVQDLEAFQTGKQYLPAALLETCRKRTVTRIACCSDGVQGIAGCKQ